MTKISIIMPIYNDSDLLEKSISSVIKQTLDDFELICVNDGSTDNSLEILNDFSKKYDFIKVFSQENQGSGKARNQGMANANGEYIAFLDADDFFIDDDALEKLYDVASKNDADMATGNIKLVNAQGKFSPFVHLDYYDEYGVIPPEKYGIPWSFYKCIFKKDFLEKNKIIFPDLLRGQDPVFLAEVLSKLDKIYTVPTDVYAYFYVSGANQCNTYVKRHDHITHYKMVFDYLSDPKFEKIVHKFRHEMIGFIDMMGEEGAKDTIVSIQDVFADDPKLLRNCEEYFYFKYKDNEELRSLVEFKINPEKPRISVMIPVYNAKDFLEDSIGSLLNQTFEDFELICVNDGSKDNSLEILNDFAKKDSRVKVIDKENGGCGSARNRALDEASGEYIYFFDPDDKIPLNTFEETYKNAICNDSDMVVFKANVFNDVEGISNKQVYFDYSKLFERNNFNHFTFDYKDAKSIVLNNSLAPWAKLYKKEFLDAYDDFRFDIGIAFDDVPFHVKSVLRAKKISFINKCLYHYRIDNPNSINSTSTSGFDIFKIFDIVENILINENAFEELKLEFYMFVIFHSMLYIPRTNSDDYFQLVKHKFEKIDKDLVKSMPNDLVKNYTMVMESENLEIFELKKKINNAEIRNKRLNNENKKLRTEIKKLDNENKKLKKFKKNLINSKSWKITKPLRGLKKRF